MRFLLEIKSIMKMKFSIILLIMFFVLSLLTYINISNQSTKDNFEYAEEEIQAYLFSWDTVISETESMLKNPNIREDSVLENKLETARYMKNLINDSYKELKYEEQNLDDLSKEVNTIRLYHNIVMGDFLAVNEDSSLIEKYTAQGMFFENSEKVKNIPLNFLSFKESNQKYENYTDELKHNAYLNYSKKAEELVYILDNDINTLLDTKGIGSFLSKIISYDSFYGIFILPMAFIFSVVVLSEKKRLGLISITLNNSSSRISTYLRIVLTIILSYLFILISSLVIPCLILIFRYGIEQLFFPSLIRITSIFDFTNYNVTNKLYDGTSFFSFYSSSIGEIYGVQFPLLPEYLQIFPYYLSLFFSSVFVLLQIILLIVTSFLSVILINNVVKSNLINLFVIILIAITQFSYFPIINTFFPFMYTLGTYLVSGGQMVSYSLCMLILVINILFIMGFTINRFKKMDIF